MSKQDYKINKIWDCFTVDLTCRDPEKEYSATKLTRMFLFSPGYRSVVFLRLSTYLKNVTFLNYLTNLMIQLLLARLSSVPGVEIHTHHIGFGLLMTHHHDIVIGNGCTIGNNVTIFNGVTLGAKTLIKYDGKTERYPTIKNNITIFTGAKILGAVTRGTGSIVGANSVVLRSFPHHSIIVGIPAKQIGVVPE